MDISAHLDVEAPEKTATTGADSSWLGKQGGTTRIRQPPAARPNSTPCCVEQYPPDCLRDRAWLHEQYVTRRLGSHAIGSLVGRSPGTVAHHLGRHGIRLRDRREAARRAASMVVYP